MTRASLLHILDHVSEISDAEIRELEQLAAAFPYCQTAHILLAKTAHDRGSMLASQRLRRAATYAANRDLLRHLLEQPAPVAAATVAEPGLAIVPAAPAADEAPTAEADSTVSALFIEDETIANSSELAAATSTVEEAEEKAETAFENSTNSASTLAGDFAEESPSTAEAPFIVLEADQDGALVSEAVAESVPTPGLETQLNDVQVTTGERAESTETPEAELTAFTEPEKVATTAEVAPVSIEEIEQPTKIAEVAVEPTHEIPTVDETSASVAEEDSGEHISNTGPEQEVAPLTTESNTLSAVLDNETEVNDLLPATAPPIRPPAEAGISRFEFDLVEPALPEPSSYLLPDLEEEVAEEPILSGILQRTAPAFHADEDLGYALGASSRLGYDLQPHDGFTLDLPLDAFFEPDALLLAHIAAHRPKLSTSSLDLINRFLKTKPRIKTAAVDAKPVEEQADLSVRSIQAAPALASESLAKIMVKQGKIDKAIEIYERLMTRQPEKKAYFADQIQQLKQPSA
ncbi:hypothetical protein SAMN06265337_0585 [Hymenobacter gelipurpurascens]|uniref:Uncharacterized protein n=1 Tax=Hymenobacter gelipurpurascens TaxID=89968 RepID=A0A212T7G3_9BACT|nr:hypothetical protein [Hymenobacter gelipurpurascens]SNC62007.1 hypothetical protein SAMN06265337_0585 [Hymenobacter gelipurpurascens]